MVHLPPTLKPAQTATALIELAVEKHNTRWDKTFFKAIFAGIMLSFGGLLLVIIAGGSTIIAGSVPGLARVLGGFVFPVGFVMIVLQGFDLLTISIVIFPIAAIKGAIPWWGIPVNWIIVTFGNLIGSLFFAAILARYDGLTNVQPYLGYIRAFALQEAVTPHWYQIFLRGIGGNWLIGVAIWQSTAASDTTSKIIASWFPIWVYVASGFVHVIGDMFSIPLAIMLHADVTTAYYIRKSLVPAYLGNIIGGLCVAISAVYFYLDDWRAGGLQDAEEAQVADARVEDDSDNLAQGKSR